MVGVRYQLVFRAKTGWLGLGFILALTAIFTVTTWIHYDWLATMRNIVFPLALAFFTWWIWVFPKLVVDDRGIAIRNQLRTIRVSWEHFQGTQANLGLYILAQGDKRIRAKNEDNHDLDLLDKNANDFLLEKSVESGTKLNEKLHGKPASRGAKNRARTRTKTKTRTRKFYSAAVPARSGLRAMASGLSDPAVPEYNFSRSLRQTLFVTPSVGARLIEQAFLHRQITCDKESGENPLPATAISQIANWWQEPNALSKRVQAQILNSPYQGIHISLNWPLFLGFVAVIGACALAWTA